MAAIDENGLKLQIRNRDFSNVYLFYGEETYLKQLYVNRIIEKTVEKNFESFNFHALEGRETTPDEIIGCCEALPMMGEYAVTLVHDMPLNRLDSAELKKLQGLISDISETTILIFWLDTVEFDSKDKKWQGIEKLVSKFGSSVKLNKKTQAEIVKLLVAGAKKRGCVLSNENARYLFSVVGDELNILLNELEKLCFFAPGREIIRNDIDLVSVKSLEATSFGMVKSLISGSFDKACESLDILFFRKTEPTAIMGALITAYVDMYRAKVGLLDSGSSVAAAGAFNYRNKEFRLTNAARDSSGKDISQVRKSLEILAEADKKLKNNFEESRARFIIEEAMIKLMMV